MADDPTRRGESSTALRRRWEWLEAVQGARRWRQGGQNPERVAFLYVVLPLLLSWLLAGSTREAGWVSGQGWEVGLGLGFAVLMLVNGVLLEHHLQVRGAALGSLRPLARWMMRALLALPLVGLLGLPFWIGWLKEPPAWMGKVRECRSRIIPTPKATDRLRLPGAGILRHRIRAVESSRAWIVWLFGINGLAVVTGAILAGGAPGPEGMESQAGDPALAVIVWGLRLVAAGSHAWLLRVHAGGHDAVRKVLRWGPPSACLLPWPWALLALPRLVVFVLRRRSTTLVATAFSGLGRVRGLASWNPSGGSRPPRRPVAAKACSVGHRFRQACAWKIAVLGPESLLLGWLMIPLGPGTIEGFVLIVLTGLGVTGLAAVWGVVRRRSGLPAARYAFVGQGVLVVGVAVGANPSETGRLLFSLGLGFSVISIFWVILRSFLGGGVLGPGSVVGSLVWLGSMILVAFLGAGMLRSPPLEEIGKNLLQALAVLAPFASPAIGWWWLERLLKPYRPHHLRSPNLPRSLRLTLGWRALTLFIPLGALAIPGWFAAIPHPDISSTHHRKIGHSPE